MTPSTPELPRPPRPTKKAPLPRIDVAELDHDADPYPTYARLRSGGPLWRGGPAQYLVTRHFDVARLLRSPRLSSAVPASFHRVNVGGGATEEFFGRIMMYQDPPRHGEIRSPLAVALQAEAATQLAPRVFRVVAELLDPLLDRDNFDVVAEVAFPLPTMVICELLGVPADERQLVRPRAEDLSKAFSLAVTAEDRQAGDAAIEWLRSYIGDLVRARINRPRADLLSAMVDAGGSDPGSNLDDLVDNAIFLFFAGFETTMNMLSTGTVLLCAHPQQMDRLRRQPGLAGRAGEEILRFDAPIQMRARFVHQPVSFDDRVVPAGRVLLLLIGSANRDEERFDHPDRFDITRDPNPHVSFGGGIHHCLGAALARLESRAFFQSLLGRFSVVEAAAPARRILGSSFRGYHSVPLAVRPA